MPKSPDCIVLCMKWGTVFPADYVNVLYRACRGATTKPFRFVCLTDDPTGLLPEVEALPIPEIGVIADHRYRDGVWRKLGLYLADLHGLTGRALFIDLDMVVLRDLDAFFDHPAPFVATDMGPAWRPVPRPGPREAGTCIFAFDIGGQTQIVENFLADPKKVMDTYLHEQLYVGSQVSSVDYWPDGWVISFKRHLRQPIGLDLIRGPKTPPPGTKVLAFHGTPRPEALIKRGHRFWDRLPHMGHGRVPWMVDYWLSHGGSLEAF